MPEQKALPAPVRIRICAGGLLDFVQRAQNIVDQFVADGIALVGTVQRDGGDGSS